MSKKQFLKVTGFIGTLAAGTALVASAATGTGAWFTDSEAGSISASTGQLDVSLTGGHANMNFANLMPGEPQSDNVTYTVKQSSGKSDVWLVLDPKNYQVDLFTGAKGGPSENGGLGGYGHFVVKDDAGAVIFKSNNLAHAQDPKDLAQCYVDADGHGGSLAKQTSETDRVPYCGVPYAIKLASDLVDGNSRNVTLEFGVSGKWTAKDITLPTVPFTIVATQAGHRPDAPNF